MQRFISGWTKINNEHVEYFGDAPPGSSSQQLAGGGQKEKSTAQQSTGAQQHAGMQYNPAVVDPRTTTFAQTPDVSLPSSSSNLSTYSFTKNGVLTTNDTHSLTASTSTAPNTYAHHQRNMMYHNTAQPHLGVSGQPVQQVQQHHLMVASGSSVSRSSRANRVSRRQQGLGGASGSYLHDPNPAQFNLQPAPPQSGADAILGRRKSQTNRDIAPEGMQGHHSMYSGALSENNRTGNSLSNTNVGGLRYSPSSSLWHSTNQSVGSSSGQTSSHQSHGGAAASSSSITASLDQMSANMSLRSHGKTIDEMQSEADAALQSIHDMSRGGLMMPASTSSRSNGSGSMMNASVGGSSSSTSHARNGNTSQQSFDTTPQQTQSIMIPTKSPPPMSLSSSSTPQNWSKRFHRQKIKRSHSRSDLVREMALDKQSTNRRNRRRDSAKSDELDVGSSTFISRQLRLERNSVTTATSSSNPMSEDGSQDADGFAEGKYGANAGSATDAGSKPRSVDSDGTVVTSNSNVATNMILNEMLSAGVTTQPQSLQHQQQRRSNESIEQSNSNAPGMQYMQNWSSQQLGTTPVTTNHSVPSIASGLTSVMESQTSPPQGFPMNVGSSSTIHSTTSLLSEQMSGRPQLLTHRPQRGNGNLQAPPANGCERCFQMESTLLALQADLEYLRTLELQREFTCRECDARSTSSRKQGNADGIAPAAAATNSAAPALPSIHQGAVFEPPNPPALLSSNQSVSSAMSVGSRGSRTSSRYARRSSNRSAGGRSKANASRAPGALHRAGSRTTTFLRDASKRLSELSHRHKRQVKQTTHERAYWQNDMHLKLEKFALMCKNLNEEAASRSNEVKETKRELEKMTSERNTLVSQVDTLKARVALYEEESVGYARLREGWTEDKTALVSATEGLARRQAETISDLENRLDCTLDALECERRSNRSRRKIIFPPNTKGGITSKLLSELVPSPPSPHRMHSLNSSATSSGDADAEDADGSRSREVQKNCQLALHEALLLSSTRERELRCRLEDMERQMSAAEEESPGLRGCAPIMRRDLSSSSL